MTSRENSRYDDRLVIQYLLGVMPEDEAERLDELSILDDEFADRLTAVENDLVDAYVRGELAEATRERFQAHYLCSPRRREKVRFAESLMVLSDRAAVPVTAVGPGRGWRWLRLSPAFAVAACLLLAAGFLTYQNFQLRTQMLRKQQERAALDQRGREAKGKLDAQGEKTKSPPGERPAITIAIVLSPQTRGNGPLPAIAIPAETGQVDFRLDLESADFAAYRVQLRVPSAGQILWQSGRLRSVSHDGVRSIFVGLPGLLLKPRNYVLELWGVAPGGGAEPLSNYAFAVVP